LKNSFANQKPSSLRPFGEVGLSLSLWCSKMKVSVVSRSGKEVVKGGLELSNSVRSFFLLLFSVFVFFFFLVVAKSSALM
jgi:hypothetical protein